MDERAARLAVGTEGPRVDTDDPVEFPRPRHLRLSRAADEDAEAGGGRARQERVEPVPEHLVVVGVRGHRCGDAERRRRRLRPGACAGEAAGVDRGRGRVDRGHGRGGAGDRQFREPWCSDLTDQREGPLVHRVEPARSAGGRGEDADRPGALDEGHGERGLGAGAAGRGIGGARDERDVLHAHGTSGDQGFSADGAVDLDDVADLARRTRGRRDAYQPTLGKDGDGGGSLDDGGDGVRERLRRSIRRGQRRPDVLTGLGDCGQEGGLRARCPVVHAWDPHSSSASQHDTTQCDRSTRTGQGKSGCRNDVPRSPSCSSRLGRAHWIRRDDR